MRVIPQNVNDNHMNHRLYADSVEYLPFAKAARYLIDKHVSAYWKNDPNDGPFIVLELRLCGYLHDLFHVPEARDRIVKWIARVLDISPLLLHNDPDIPF